MVEPQVALRNGQLKNALECLLFVAADPLSAAEIAEALEVDEQTVEAVVRDLSELLEERSGLQVVPVAGGYQLCTRPEYAEICAKFLHPSNQKLSRAALETLAVIAYRQPVTQPEIEAIRGVSIDGVMKTILERGLIKEVGRKPTVGRPILYSTTKLFLQHFGLAELTDLPDVDTLGAEEVLALEAQASLFDDQEVVARQRDAAVDNAEVGA